MQTRLNGVRCVVNQTVLITLSMIPKSSQQMLKPETIGLNTLLCSFDKVGKYALEAILCDVVDFSSDVSPEMI